MRLPRKVYAIQHNVTKRIYIGTSCNVDERYLTHMYALRSNKHNVEDMQDDFNKYGEDYSVFILDDINTYDESIKEYEYMLEYNSHIRGNGYNYKDVVLLKKINKPVIPYKVGTPFTNEKVGNMKERNRNKHQDLVDFIGSLTEEQVDKIISRIGEIKELLEKNQ